MSLQAAKLLAERLNRRHDLPPIGRKHHALAAAIKHLKTQSASRSPTMRLTPDCE